MHQDIDKEENKYVGNHLASNLNWILYTWFIDKAKIPVKNHLLDRMDVSTNILILLILLYSFYSIL